MTSPNVRSGLGADTEAIRASFSRGIAWLKSELGASLVEYALLLALIGTVAIGAITLVGREAEREFDCVALELDNPGISQLVDEKKHKEDHWHDLSATEEAYATACLEGDDFRAPRKTKT